MENTLEENQRLADQIIKPIMDILDKNRGVFDIEKLNGTLDNMKSQQSFMAAWPTDETMAKASTMDLQNMGFKLIIELIKVRQAIFEDAIKPKETIGETILKQFGF